MWQKPWGYKEGFAICGGLFILGILFQVSFGKANLDLFTYPLNVMAGATYLAFLMILTLLARKIWIFRWPGSYPAAITALVAMIFMTVVMGLTRQLRPDIPVYGIQGVLGFSQMLSAYPFWMLFFWFITVLGLVTFKRLLSFRFRDIPFFLNHLGLFLALTGAVLGNGDRQRLEMTTITGRPEWRAFNEKKEMVELPVAIELMDFSIEEYPPKLMVLENESGRALPVGKPENILIEEDFVSGDLLDWTITVKQQLPLAASVATEDTIKFVEYHSLGATTALYVEAVNPKTGDKREGWVSCGSFMFPYKALRLTDEQSLIMPEREPRKYKSEVKVYTESEKMVDAVIEVNKPFKIDGWKIYQLSYDEAKGKWSDISIFEIVKDPWLPVVYTGIWMMIAGAIGMFIIAQKRKEEEQ